MASRSNTGGYDPGKKPYDPRAGLPKGPAGIDPMSQGGAARAPVLTAASDTLGLTAPPATVSFPTRDQVLNTTSYAGSTGGAAADDLLGRRRGAGRQGASKVLLG